MSDEHVLFAFAAGFFRFFRLGVCQHFHGKYRVVCNEGENEQADDQRFLRDTYQCSNYGI